MKYPIKALQGSLRRAPLVLAAILLALVAHIAFAQTANATTYYVSPGGNDNNNGQSDASPWATFDRAWQAIYPGDTLIVMDGTYNQSLNPNKRNGEPGHPITVRAQHDGKAIVDGQYQRVPVKIGDTWPGPIGDYYVVEGIVARNSSEHVYILRGDHNTLRRVSGINADTNGNTAVFLISGDDILVEDCVAYGTGRKMINVYGAQHDIVRRCFAYWTGWDGRNFCGATWPWGDNIQIYNGSNNILENNIAYGPAPFWSISVQANADAAVADNNKVLGSIAVGAGMTTSGKVIDWGTTRPQPTECTGIRDFNWASQRVGFMLWGQGHLSNNIFQDIAAWGNAGLGFSSARPFGPAPQGGQLTRATLFNNGIDAPPADGGKGTSALPQQLGDYTVTDSKIEGTAFQGGGARLTERYVNGNLTNEPLWPWPMEGRILAETGVSISQLVAPVVNVSGFNLTINPPFQHIKTGGQVKVAVSVVGIGGFSDSVNVSIDNPANSGLRIEPASASVAPGNQATFTVTDIPSDVQAASQTHSFRITGSAAKIEHTADVMLLEGGSFEFLPMITNR